MYVCVCQAVTDGQIRDAICEGACSMRDLRQRLGVASECGRCSQCALGILRAAQAGNPLPAGDLAAAA